MRGLFAAAIAIAALLLASVPGCRDNNPPPPRVPVPTQYERDERALREREPARPLPAHTYSDPGMDRPFDDPPLLTQRPPEQRAFVESYRAIGSPRITLFVNRTLEGQIIPVNRDDPLVTVERTRRSTGDVTIEQSETYRREGWRRPDDERERRDHYESRGPAEYRDTIDVYLRPGQYDEVDAREIDYEAIERIMTDWIAANGQVTVISPMMTRERLSDQEVKELQDGRPQVLREIAAKLDADVLIQVQARPTRQTRDGLEVRILAEAINTRSGESIGRAVVDVPPPLEKVQINDYTRYLARKLMDDMTETWRNPPPARPPTERMTIPEQSPDVREPVPDLPPPPAPPQVAPSPAAPAEPPEAPTTAPAEPS